MKTTKMLAILVLALGLMVCFAQVGQAAPMGTAFTYQGRLIDANDVADGVYDFWFILFDEPNGGGFPLSFIVNDLDVIDGYFTVELDFGSDAFDGDARWLEISVRPGDSNDVSDFVTLSPRQEVTPTPYALYAKTAGNALTGSGTTNRIAKFTGPSTLGDSALYEHNYYVGVGTANPRGMFDVDCDGGDIYLDTFSSQVYIGDVDGDGDETLFTVDDSAGKFTFENGKVGIGTTTPRASLEVTNTGSSHAIWASTSDIPVYAHRTGTAGTWPAVAGDCNSEASSASGVRGRILSTSPGSLGAGVYGYNYGTGSNGVGVRGHHVGSGTGVYGRCDDGKGVYGVSTNGYAGYFAGGKNYFEGSVGIGTTSPGAKLEVRQNDWQDIVKIGTPDTSNRLILSSGPDYASVSGGQTNQNSIVISHSTGNVGIGHSLTLPQAKLQVNGDLKVKGDVTVDGAYVGSFPRPAYDSGWVPLLANQELTCIHNLGGNVDNYVVDLQMKWPLVQGINNSGIGGYYNGAYFEGAYWKNLTTNSIKVYKLKDNADSEEVRIRIWVYK